MTKTVYLIEELWTDSLENESSLARGYSSVGFVEDEATAMRIVKEAGILPKASMWAIFEDTPRKRYKVIASLDSSDEPPVTRHTIPCIVDGCPNDAREGLVGCGQHSTAEPKEVIHTVGIGYCDNCDCEHCSEIRSPARTGEEHGDV